MAAKMIVAPEVERDLATAYDWYEDQRVGLGDDFLSRIDACIRESSRTRNCIRQFTKAIGEDWCSGSRTPSITSTPLA